MKYLVWGVLIYLGWKYLFSKSNVKATQNAQPVIKESSKYIYVSINDTLSKDNIFNAFAKPLHEVLTASGKGKVIMENNLSTYRTDLDTAIQVVLYQYPDGMDFLKSHLKRLQIPDGSSLSLSAGDERIIIPL